jgi:acetoacetyl-CoA synthetase
MWNWMVSALALGVCLALYEGSPMYPKPHAMLDIVALEQVNVWGASAALFAALEKQGVAAKAETFASLRTILSTGSPLLKSQYDYLAHLLGRPIQISSISGGSDIISCFALGHPKLPVYRGELQALGLGMDVAVFNELGQALDNQQGELVCRSPFPSMPLGFWQDEGHIKYQASYFAKYPNVWAHGDYALLTPHHGLVIFGRSDATLNPNGVRFGAAELYQVVNQIAGIKDAVAVAQNWQQDTRVVLFVQLHPKCQWNESLRKQIAKTIKIQLSPRHVPAKILPVTDIPRTINGKLLETAVKKLIHGQRLDNLAVIVNPESLKEYWQRPELAT